ncbi:hypothetical protein HC723_16565 [Vibrio sp. S11_S32]|uniref:thermostable hemolysin n=1 Tax=Vibrio sp. S11_S32 TaxID=2720225 RepID=UPI0016812976|nr:hypothetical protein [Vibrio sp. S11_S32]
MRKYIYIESSTESHKNITTKINIITKQENSTEILNYISKIYSETYNADVSPSSDLLVYTTKGENVEILACAGMSMGKDDKVLREIIQSGEYIKNIDVHIDDNTAEIVKGFSKSKKIHVFG